MSISDSIPAGESRWYSVNEFAVHLGVAVDTVYRWIENKGLPILQPSELITFRKQPRPFILLCV